jgi:hypothetical protein
LYNETQNFIEKARDPTNIHASDTLEYLKKIHSLSKLNQRLRPSASASASKETSQPNLNELSSSSPANSSELEDILKMMK